MGRGGEGERVSRRIVAILMSLADLALCASGASWPVRWLLVRVFCTAERIARTYALEAGVPALAPVGTGPKGFARADLERLALRLRTLAMLLAVAMARLASAAMPSGGRLPALAVDATQGAAPPADRALSLVDTS